MKPRCLVGGGADGFAKRMVALMVLSCSLAIGAGSVFAKDSSWVQNRAAEGRGFSPAEKARPIFSILSRGSIGGDSAVAGGSRRVLHTCPARDEGRSAGGTAV